MTLQVDCLAALEERDAIDDNTLSVCEDIMVVRNKERWSECVHSRAGQPVLPVRPTTYRDSDILAVRKG